MKKKEIPVCQQIWNIADEIIADCGIKDHITDIYLATPCDFLSEEKEWKRIRKKRKLPEYFDWHTSLALLALWIYEDKTCKCG